MVVCSYWSTCLQVLSAPLIDWYCSYKEHTVVVCSYWSTCLQVLSAPLIDWYCFIQRAYCGCLFILVYLPAGAQRTVVVCSYWSTCLQVLSAPLIDWYCSYKEHTVVVCSYWSTCLQVLSAHLIDWYCFIQRAYCGCLFILVYLPAGAQRTSNRLVLFHSKSILWLFVQVLGTPLMVLFHAWSIHGCLFILVYLPAGAWHTSNRLVLFHTKSILWLFVHIGLPACRCSAHL